MSEDIMTEEFSSSDGNPAYIGHEEGVSVVVSAMDARSESSQANIAVPDVGSSAE